MDNQQQPFNPNDLLVFQNIDNEDHEWYYDKIRSPLPYYIRAGETREMPFFIAKQGVETLIDKVLFKQNRNHMSPIFRDELRDKIVLGLKHLNNIRAKTENELELEALQRKKEQDPYRELFKKREVDEEKNRKLQYELQKPAAPLYESQGLKDPIVKTDELRDGPITQPLQETAQGVPNPSADFEERQNVYNLLTTKLHMDLTHLPTKEKFDSMNIGDLKNEFKDELPELSNPATTIVTDTKQTLQQDGMPLMPTRPVQPRPAVPAQPVPTTPQISMNPQAPAAPLLDQQLGSIN